MSMMLIVGWFYLATPDFEAIHMRGPFLSKDACMKHEEMYVPRTWVSAGCRLKAINFGDEKDISPIVGKDKDT